MALLEQTVARPQSSALLVIACETLQDTAGVLKETQREILLLTLVEKLRGSSRRGWCWLRLAAMTSPFWPTE